MISMPSSAPCRSGRGCHRNSANLSSARTTPCTSGSGGRSARAPSHALWRPRTRPPPDGAPRAAVRTFVPLAGRRPPPAQLRGRLLVLAGNAAQKRVRRPRLSLVLDDSGRGVHVRHSYGPRVLGARKRPSGGVSGAGDLGSVHERISLARVHGGAT